MPNGTSALFFVKRADLALLLDQIGNDLIVGDVLEMNTSTTRLVTASEVRELVRNYDPNMSTVPKDHENPDDVLTTEQDHEYYLLHLNTWVSISKTSSLFLGMGRLRQDWIERVYGPELRGAEAESESDMDD